MVTMNNGNCVNLARCLASYVRKAKGSQLVSYLHFSILANHHYFILVIQYWIQIPLVNENSLVYGADEEGHDDPWEWWNKFRQLCGTANKKMFVG